jgi:hypothetical protein
VSSTAIIILMPSASRSPHPDLPALPFAVLEPFSHSYYRMQKPRTRSAAGFKPYLAIVDSSKPRKCAGN